MTINEKNALKDLSKNMLVDGFPLVMDMEKSHGNRIVDLMTGQEYHDFFTCFATVPVSYNHPKLKDKTFLRKLQSAALINPTNADIYTIEFADAVATFRKNAIPGYLHHLFFISGGTLAVENAIKTAFDWKIKKNWKKGVSKSKELGTKVIHFKDAFHGRSGYTLSLTNTDPNKIALFPKFDWPRIENPRIIFPLEKHLKEIEASEKRAIKQIKDVIKKEGKDIAALIIEPIQGEGGDNHFRAEFFQELRKITLENDILFIMDEIQTGVGITGKMWAHQHFNIEPDIIAFGKKTQICGILAGKRIDEIEDNVFAISGRINSTWGGNLVDAVRFARYLEIIKEDKLIDNARKTGDYLLKQLTILQKEFPKYLSAARSKGLFAAIDFPSTEIRNEVKDKLFKKKFIFLPSGRIAIRFRPILDITKDEIDICMKAWREVLSSLK
jgi:L-lysine 6-transaminase